MAIVRAQKPNPNEHLTTSPEGIEFIKSNENCILKSFVDTVDSKGNELYSIGWGHTSALGEPFVTKDMIITEEQANSILLNDITTFERKIKDLVTVPLTQNQFDALVSFCYNNSTKDFASLVKNTKLNKGNYNITEDLLYYCRPNGKVSRKALSIRNKEAELWRK